MAAPTPTARQVPAGKMLENGFRSLVTLSEDPDIEMWEKIVGMPGLEGGEPIDITTMHNVRWTTKSPSALIDGEDVTITVAFDPIMYTRALQQINRRQTITHTLPDGSTVCYFGYMRSFKPNPFQRGEHPTAEVVIVQTNFDPVNDVEADPVLTNVTGT